MLAFFREDVAHVWRLAGGNACGDFIFGRHVDRQGYVVLRPLFGQKQGQESGENLFGAQKGVRIVNLVNVWIRETLVHRQQVVKVGCAAASVPQDK